MKIRIKKSNIGSLHTALGVPQDEKIPHSKLQIHESDSPSLKKKKQFALNAAKWKHEMGGYLPMHFDGDVIGNPNRVAVGAMNPRTGQPYTMEDVQVYTKSLGKFPMTFGTQYGGGQKNTNVLGVDNSYSTMYGDYEQNPTMPSSNRKFDYAQSTLGLSPVEPLKNRVQFTPPSEPSESDFMVPQELYRVNAGSQQVRTLNTPLLVDPGKRYTANMNQVTPLGAATLPSPNISRPTREDVGMYNPNADMQTGTPNTSNWLKDNYGLVGQLGSAALSASIQSGRINRLARPRTLSNVRLSDRVATPAYVDYSAERNAIDRASLNAMGDAQRGFGSSAAAQAFKNKARLNQLEGTGKSFQQQSNVNTQLKNQFLAAQQEAAMKEAMINNEIEKYNLENIYGFDTMTAQQRNAITAMLANTAGQTFGTQTAYKNQLDQANILANQYDPSVLNDMIKNGKLKVVNGKLVQARYGGTIKKRSLKK